MRKFAPILDKYIISRIGANRYCEKMATSLENIDKSKVSADRIEGLDAKIQAELSTAVTGAASTIITSDLTANKLLISNGNGKVAASTITSTDIDKIFSYYGTCSTDAATQTKDVVCSGFVLKTGSSIRVKFTNYQNYNGVFKLNVNSTGAKEVKRYGTTNSARYDFRAGEVISFTYDGTYWLMEDEGLADTTYFGKTKLVASATSTSTSLALTPSALNSYAQNTIANYPVYSTSSTYAVGDRVRYNWQTWECKTAITTAESWNASHWTALLDLQTQIDNKAADNTVVKLTGNQTISGEKTFADTLYVDDNIHITNNKNTYRHIYTDNSVITKGTAPSANTGTELVLKDSSESNIGSVAIWYSSDGNCVAGIRAYKPAVSSTDNVSIQIHYDANGTTYGTCPTPALSDDSDKIATTKWFNDKLVLVSALPASPDPNVWYGIPE